MATGTYPNAASIVDKTAADKFIPEIWSDEIIAAYKKSLKMAPIVKRLQMTGKKGDVIHIPKPTRGKAFEKAEATAVTIQADTETDIEVKIDQHFEYSRFIEDIVEVQALNSMRQFYTDDAGYALASQIDDHLFNAATGFGDGTLTLAPTDGADWENSNSYMIDGTNGLVNFTDDTMLAADVFTDQGFRSLIQNLDDADVPMDNRQFVFPPVLRNTLMGIERYVSSEFRPDQTVKTGFIGSVYGIELYVSSNAPVMETVAQNGAASGVASRACLLFHSDALVLAEQMAVRSQTQYMLDYLSTLYTADTLYGVQAYRPEAGLILAVPA